MKLINITKEANDKCILKDINLDIIDSGLVFIKGDSGSGKTTLLNIISKVDVPTSGVIEQNNREVSTLFQDNNLFENLTVEENLSIYENYNIDEYLEKFKIQNLKKQKVKKLSVGEKRRVSIIRTLLKESEVLILDEPNTNLDEENIRNLFNILKEISKTKLIICTLHGCDYLNELADQIVTIKNGSIVENTITNNLNNKYEIQEQTINKKYLNNLSKYFFKEIPLIHIALVIFLLISYFIINMIGNFDFVKIETDTLKNENDNRILFSYNTDIKDKVKTEIYLKDNSYVSLSLSTKDTNNNYYLYTPLNYFYYYKEMKYEIIGEEPSNENEIMISELLAEQIVYHGILDSEGNEITFKTKEEILNKTVSLSGAPVIITGIVKQDLEKYRELKNYELWNYNESEPGKKIYDELNFQSDISYFSQIIYVDQSFENYILNYVEKNTLEVSPLTYLNLNDLNSQRTALKEIRKSLPKITLKNIENNDLTNGTVYSSSISHYLKKYYKYYLILRYIIPVIVILIVLELNSIYQLILKKNKKDILILKSLNLSKKEISKVLNNSIAYTLVLSLVSSIILSTITSLILNEITTLSVGFYLKPFNINFIHILVSLIIIVIIYIIGKLILNKKIDKLELIQLRNI